MSEIWYKSVIYWSSCNVRVILVIFQQNLNFFQQISKNNKISNFMKIHRRVFCVRMDGQTDGETDMTKLIVAFRSFADAHSNIKKISKVRTKPYMSM